MQADRSRHRCWRRSSQAPGRGGDGGVHGRSGRRRGGAARVPRRRRDGGRGLRARAARRSTSGAPATSAATTSASTSTSRRVWPRRPRANEVLVSQTACDHLPTDAFALKKLRRFKAKATPGDLAVSSVSAASLAPPGEPGHGVQAARAASLVDRSSRGLSTNQGQSGVSSELGTRSGRFRDGANHSRCREARRERDLGRARRADIVHSSRLMRDLRDARNQGERSRGRRGDGVRRMATGGRVVCRSPRSGRLC